MDDKTTALIERLAEKLGTTAVQLWDVLLHQALISGTIDLVISIIMVLIAIGVVRFVKGKTTKPKEGPFKQAEWRGEGAALAWFGTVIYLILTGGVLLGLMRRVVVAFLNPDYWALSHILNSL